MEKKIKMMRAIKRVIVWRREEVTLAQVVRESFLEKVTFELPPEV